MQVICTFLKYHHRRLLILAAGGLILALWTGLWMRILGLPPREAANLGRRIWPAVGSLDGTLIALHGDPDKSKPGVTVWSVRQREEVVTLPLSTAAVGGYAWPRTFSPDGSLLATMEGRGKGWAIVVWELSSSRQLLEVCHDRYAEWVAIAPDNATVAMVRMETLPNGGDGYVTRIWNLKTGVPRVVASAPVDVRCLAYSPDGRTLAAGCCVSGSAPGLIKLWDAETGLEQATLSMPVPGWPYALTFSPDGRTLATAESHGYLRMWDIESGSEKVLFKHDEDDATEVKRLRFSPDAGILAVEEDRNLEYSPSTENWPDWLKRNLTAHTVSLWDINSGERLARLPEDHLLTFTDDGRSLVTYGCNGTLRWWDVPPPGPIGYFLLLSALPTLLFTALLWWRLGR
jgi:WD40 repeat protein